MSHLTYMKLVDITGIITPPPPHYPLTLDMTPVVPNNTARGLWHNLTYATNNHIKNQQQNDNKTWKRQINQLT